MQRAPDSLLVCTLFLSSCAITGPPYITPDTQEPVQGCPTPEVVLLEGQPKGLLIQINLPENSEHPACNTPKESLALLRQVITPDNEPGEFQTHTVFERTQDNAKALWNDGELKFLDSQLQHGTLYRYAALLKDKEGRVGRPSSPVSLQWLAPPKPPTAVMGDPVGAHIHLTWSGDQDTGALVFRRNISVQGSYQRATGVLRAGTQVFLDTQITQGTVYSYIISTVHFSGDVPMLGPPSPEVYVRAMPTLK